VATHHEAADESDADPICHLPTRKQLRRFRLCHENTYKEVNSSRMNPAHPCGFDSTFTGRIWYK